MFKCSHLYLKCPFPLYLCALKETAYMCTTHNKHISTDLSHYHLQHEIMSSYLHSVMIKISFKQKRMSVRLSRGSCSVTSSVPSKDIK